MNEEEFKLFISKVRLLHEAYKSKCKKVKKLERLYNKAYKQGQQDVLKKLKKVLDELEKKANQFYDKLNSPDLEKGFRKCDKMWAKLLYNLLKEAKQ